MCGVLACSFSRAVLRSAGTAFLQFLNIIFPGCPPAWPRQETCRLREGGGQGCRLSHAQTTWGSARCTACSSCSVFPAGKYFSWRAFRGSSCEAHPRNMWRQVHSRANMHAPVLAAACAHTGRGLLLCLMQPRSLLHLHTVPRSLLTHHFQQHGVYEHPCFACAPVGIKLSRYFWIGACCAL